MRVGLFILAIAFFPGIALAQTKEDVEKQRAQIRAFHECFFNLQSKKAISEESFTLSNRKVVKALARSDFERSAFVSADETLREVLSWEKSPYLWRLRHMKNTGKALMDAKDLTRWEVDSFGQIADTYFESNPSTFHIASHGLVEPDGSAAGLIKIGGEELDASETAELICKSMTVTTDEGDAAFNHVINAENQTYVVVVHSCHSAEGDNNFAKQLSLELSKFIKNVTVVGAPDVLFCAVDESGRYQEYVASSVKDIERRNPALKKWKAYRNGEDTGQGQYDYNETIRVIQSESGMGEYH